MSRSDHELIAQAIRGDEDALTALLQRYAPQIARELRVQNAHLSKLDVDDVLQVTFLEVFLSIRGFDLSRADSFSGWLLRIAQNNLRDMTRELQRAKRPPPERQLPNSAEESCVALVEMLTGTSATPSRHAAAREAQSLIRQAIERLPPDYRQVVQLCDLDGRNATQVGEELGRSPGAVHMLRARAHERLRANLGSESRFFSRRA